MYKHHPSIVFGFHACDKSVAEKLISNGHKLSASNNDYDWLGSGMYFWENSVHRAERFGEELKVKGYLKDPVVVGAAINLGYCLDLLDSESLYLLRNAYRSLVSTFKAAGEPIPVNKSLTTNRVGDLLLRNLDCATINFLHYLVDQTNEQAYDSVRGVFWEGDSLYPNAGFKEKNHIQLCIRNPNCIKGYFWPLTEDPKNIGV